MVVEYNNNNNNKEKRSNICKNYVKKSKKNAKKFGSRAAV